MKNIVLIGMPSCGKSTVGALLARATARDFYDTDEEILSRIGMSISDYFASCGERAFRQVESEVIASLSQKENSIIATGGGAILAQENVQNLRKNGVLVWLDRPLASLLATSDRPLSQSKEALEALYQARLPLYVAAADLRIDASLSPEAIVEILTKELL